MFDEAVSLTSLDLVPKMVVSPSSVPSLLSP